MSTLAGTASAKGRKALHFGDMLRVKSKVEGDTFGSQYLINRIGQEGKSHSPRVKHETLKSYAQAHHMIVHAIGNAKDHVADKIATYTGDIRFSKAVIADSTKGEFAPYISYCEGAKELSSEDESPEPFTHGCVEPPVKKKERAQRFIETMQALPHKGIAEGSTASDFKQEPDQNITKINTPFDGSLVADDEFEDPEPQEVHIEECRPAAVQVAINIGNYVTTRAAPYISETQQL